MHHAADLIECSMMRWWEAHTTRCCSVAVGLLLFACGGRSTSHELTVSVETPNPPPPDEEPPLESPDDPVPDEPSPDEPLSTQQPSTTDNVPPPDPAGYALIGMCPSKCTGCTFPGTVFAQRLDTGEEVIDSDTGHCAVLVPLGVEVAIDAIARLGVAFVAWESLPPGHPYGWHPCVCEGSGDPHCGFMVTERTYCGATYQSE